MKYAVFVPDAHARPCIAAIRSLGRAGYCVHAGSSTKKDLGLRSAFVNNTAIYPSFDDPNFIEWMRKYVARHNIRMIVPTGSILHALRPAFKEFKPLLPVTEDEDALFDCFDKATVVQKFISADPVQGMMENHPVSSVIDLKANYNYDFLPQSKTGYYLKADRLRNHGSATATSFAFAEDADSALALLNAMSIDWEVALVQEACTGFQIGVSVLMDNGEALAVSCVRDCYPRPHSRGTMSLRESCWFPEVANDTIKRLSFLKWQGCAMGEYRFDEVSGTFNLIEINFRYWQYLHLDLWAGMDYPRMQAEWFLDGKKCFQNKPNLGVICRDTWPGEVSHLVNELRRRDVGILGHSYSILLFIARFLNPKIHQDFFFPGDRWLYLNNLYGYLKDDCKSIFSKLKRKVLKES